jgi:26S proteasome regulatory subunit N7
MADDSVPLPFPNLSVPQWYYQFNVPSHREAATASFWQAIEKDEMAPYIKSLALDPPVGLVEKLEKKNADELASIATKLADAEENQGESEISELLRAKAMYLCRIGDKVSELLAS